MAQSAPLVTNVCRQAHIEVGQTLDVEWVDVSDFDPGEDELRVYGYFTHGCARFARAEGAWYGRDSIYFACTTGGEARKGRRGSDRESQWPRPYPPWRRPWQALSNRYAPGRQFTGRREGEWELRRCDRQNRVAWNAGYLPGGFPGA